ncbi:flagellar protein FliT [Cupriavidus sp. IDO]|uniref:flagellar protein FliT n=1 Tax=Cupriavidus sp. IDO TaxID=1539142 RepID=UPI0005792592|nr:flagellar protein FliT [Cupriavidus sp. IDO]KWR79429.1 flagellar assembly protein FliT [Cupriavidus sp. IDO]
MRSFKLEAPGPVTRGYEELLLLSEQMLEAARAGNWDAMSDLQQVYVAEVDQLRALGPQPVPSTQERTRRYRLLERILAHDAAIRQIIMPQMSQLEALLGNSRRRQELGQAYGVAI